MCELLHYFCDCELKHRIEAIVSFSDSFVSKLQFNQKFRYNELMLALNMSAAVTAKKTKEFRSPPQEQVGQLNQLRWADQFTNKNTSDSAGVTSRSLERFPLLLTSSI